MGRLVLTVGVKDGLPVVLGWEYPQVHRADQWSHDELREVRFQHAGAGPYEFNRIETAPKATRPSYLFWGIEDE